MSKEDTPETKLKGKQKKIAEANARKAEAKAEAKKTASGLASSLNYGCCCTCVHYPHKISHETQPCKVAGKYVARKAQMPCYKCKFS